MFNFVAIISALLLTITAHAAKLDITTHDDIIKRLEEVLPSIKNQKSEQPILMRLADLYADRARLKALDEGEQKCNDCKGSRTDRQQAIKYYQSAFIKASADQKQKALLQTAHLYSLNGDNEKSENVFREILNKKSQYPASLVGEAHAGYGEALYRRGEFKNAKKQFEMALGYKISKSDFIQYRLAWCNFNDGENEKARTRLVNLLKSNAVTDLSFKKDLARDLTTFIARDEISDQSLNELLALSPEEDRKSNLFFLGQEADRLGNKPGSLLIWQRYAKLKDVKTEESLEIQIRTAQTLYDQGKTREALQQYKAFYETLNKANCAAEEVCSEMRARSRSFVHTWIKKEKTNPTLDLLAALEVFVKNNPNDGELIQWTGRVARVLNENQKAAQYYHLAADQSTKPGQEKLLEGSLLAEIECSEDSTDFQVKRSSLEHYLQLNGKGERRDEVRYKLARLTYEEKDYAQAFIQFNQLATEKNKLSESVKIQAADLALDSLALLKDSEKLEKYSTNYASTFPAKKIQYLTIARKASVNQAVTSYNGGNASKPQMKESLTRLQLVSLVGATEQEKIALLKNQIQVAEKIPDIESVELAATKLLAIRTLSATDKEFALGRRLWAAELKLNFSLAYKTALAMDLTNVSADQRLLKIALLAELAGNSPRRYYQQFLATSHNSLQKNLVRAKLVRESSNPWKLLRQNKRELRQTPDIYASVILEAFAKDSNINELTQYLNEQAIRRTAAAAILARFVNVEKSKPFAREIAAHKLQTRSEKSLQKTLKERLALLRKAEGIARRSVQSGEVTAQVISLAMVARENDRLYRDLIRLPIPKGLNKNERQQYQVLILQKANPFKISAERARSEVEKLFSSAKGFEQLLAATETATGGMRKMVVRELKILAPYATRSTLNKIERGILAANAVPPRKEVEQARADLQADPFDQDKIRNLKRLEAHRDSTSMVAFLEARLSTKNGAM